MCLREPVQQQQWWPSSVGAGEDAGVFGLDLELSEPIDRHRNECLARQVRHWAGCDVEDDPPALRHEYLAIAIAEAASNPKITALTPEMT